MPTPVSAPVVSSITFDKPSGYNSGDTIHATVVYVAGVSSTASVQTFTGTATDSITGQTGNLQVNFTVTINANDVTSVAVSDSGNRVWAKVSDSGSVAVFTATA